MVVCSCGWQSGRVPIVGTAGGVEAIEIVGQMHLRAQQECHDGMAVVPGISRSSWRDRFAGAAGCALVAGVGLFPLAGFVAPAAALPVALLLLVLAMTRIT